MSDTGSVTIPPASSLVFGNGISHPDLWLWDSWILRQDEKLHLYCLALNRHTPDGTPIRPGDRNDHAFHVRHFTSQDSGGTWRDQGCFAQSGMVGDGSDRHSIWSGSVASLPGGNALVFAHTGIRKAGPRRPFIQSVNMIAASSPDAPLAGPKAALLCAERDYDLITAAGYYLGPRDMLGDQDGEEGGPILSWRDPFVFVGHDGTIHLFISAKTGPGTPAIAHAIIEESGGDFALDCLRPPIELPDSRLYTQAELPKVYHDRKNDLYYMLISTSNRLYEGQPDKEVSKDHRLFRAGSLAGPWAAYCETDSLLPDLGGLFGSSPIKTDFATGDFTLISPVTEMARPPSQLTFAPVRSVNIYSESVCRTETLT